MVKMLWVILFCLIDFGFFLRGDCERKIIWMICCFLKFGK